MEDKHIIWSHDIQFDELAQGLCDAEAVQLFHDRINKIHQIEQADKNSDDKTSNESSFLSLSHSQFSFSSFKLSESEEESNNLLDFF